MKFLGMEIAEYEHGFFANQANYIYDKKDVEGFRRAKTPTMKDMYPMPEENPSSEEVKEAQKVVGELLWLSTRRRPEISYVTSRCSQMILTAPRWVKSMGEMGLSEMHCRGGDLVWKRWRCELGGGKIACRPGDLHGHFFCTYRGWIDLARSHRGHLE